MSNERPERDNDPLVTAGYRDLAQERTPERLDDAVLARARAAAKPRYGRLRSWTRPLAWAATIVLSVTIVLQLTQAPRPDAVPAVSEDVASRPAPARRENAGEGGAMRLEKAVHAPTEPGQEERQRDRPAVPAVESQPAAAAEPRGRLDGRAGLSTDALVPDDADMMRDAENMARMRSGADLQEPEPAVAETTFALEKKGVAQYCDDEARATAETWQDCIRDLEKAGRTEEAQAERLVFEASHPDY